MEPVNKPIKSPIKILKSGIRSGEPHQSSLQPQVVPSAPVIKLAPKIKVVKAEKKFTGKNVEKLRQQVNFYENTRESDAALQRTLLLPYEENGVQNPQKYEAIWIGRRSNDPYESVYAGRVITGVFQFDDNWPEQPPKLIIDRLPGNKQMFQSVNVYATGEVCHFLLNPVTWKIKRSSVLQLMQEIESLWYEPNFEDPANMPMSDRYQEDLTGYWAFQREQAQYMLSSEDYE